MKVKALEEDRMKLMAEIERLKMHGKEGYNGDPV